MTYDPEKPREPSDPTIGQNRRSRPCERFPKICPEPRFPGTVETNGNMQVNGSTAVPGTIGNRFPGASVTVFPSIDGNRPALRSSEVSL